MSEDTKDPIRMKKDILSSHIPFIQKMLEKVKNTEFEKKWQQMYDCIMSDKKKLNLDQISKMNKTIVGLKCKMMQIEPKKEKIQLKAELIESAVVTTIQPPVINRPIKIENKVNTQKEPKVVTKIEVSLEKPPLSNDDITQLLVETAETTITQSVPIPAKVNEVVSKVNEVVVSKSVDRNQAEKMDSIEGLMNHIHGQSNTPEKKDKRTDGVNLLFKDPNTKVKENVPSASKQHNSNTTKKPEKLKDTQVSKEKKSDVSKAQDKTYVKSNSRTTQRSASVLLPSPNFENALTSVQTKAFKIPKLSKKIDPPKNVTIEEVSTPTTKKSVSQNQKRRASVCSSNSTKSYEPLPKKSSVEKVDLPVEITKVKEKRTRTQKKDVENLKTRVDKIPDTPIDVPKTSELMLSLENLVGKDGLKKMKSIFVDSTDEINKPSTSTIVKESLKRPKENSNLKANSVKKSKLIEQICNDDVVGKNEVKTARKKSPKKTNELDRLNQDINNSFIRDSVLHATGRRACTIKTIEEIKIKSEEEAREMKNCSVVLHRLQLSEQDMPFNINNLSLININCINSVQRSKSPVKPKKFKKPTKPRVKKYKKGSNWNVVARKPLETKDDEWEDVDEDQDDSAGPSTNVKLEPDVPDDPLLPQDDSVLSEIIQNNFECDDEVPDNSELLKILTSENPVITSNEKPTSPNIDKKFVDITLNNKTKPVIIPFKTVFNLSYAVLPSGTVYKCTCNDCKYQTFDQPSFVSHLNDNHLTELWHGLCKICNKTIEINSDGLKNFIAFEFIHMLDCHILNNKSPSAVVNLQNAGNSKDSVAFVNSPSFLPKITMNNHYTDFHAKKIGGNIVGKIIPMIKVPMNCLMSAKQPKETVKSVIQPKPQPVISKVVRKPPSTSWTETVINAPTKPTTTIMHPLKIIPSNKTYVIYDNEPNDLLRPWIQDQEVTKSRVLCEEMLTEICLSATFKCMGTTCSYYTSDENLFRTHLRAHLKYQFWDKPNFSKCSYCSFQDLETENIINHIKSSHTHDRYQCPYCFYRTIVDFNVLTHMELFHKMKRKTIIECNLPRSISYALELETIKKTRSNFVPPIICVFCKLKFYVFKTFISHINEHNEVFHTKCIKCNKSTNKSSLHKHLVSCHGFGLFQCVYCKFGTNTFEIINHHLTNLHPSKLPMFCERSQALNAGQIPESSIDSTCLKHINQVVHISLIKKLSFPDADLQNNTNVGKLDRNLIVRPIKPSQLNTNPNTEDYDKDVNLFGSNLTYNQDQAAEPVLLDSNISTAPSTSTRSVGECKLQIQNVYSLSNVIYNNNK